MKKLLTLVAILGLTVSIVGCGDKKAPEKKPADAAPKTPA